MVKVIELFAGYGSQHIALERIKKDKLIKDFEYEIIGISEIDKNAIKAYELLHGKVNNLGDIRHIDVLPDCDLITYSFPCQDLSNVNTNGVGLKGEKSGLIYDVLRLVKKKQPKYLLMENVPGLINKNNIYGFMEVQKELGLLGYSNHYTTLKADNLGAVQGRERVFMVSI